MFYLFHGDDDLAISEAVAELRRRLFEDDPMAELNYGELDGRRLDLGPLREAAEALPFMGERRLLVVRGLVERCNPRGRQAGRKELSEGLQELLAGLPPTTRLVLADGTLFKNNPVLRWAAEWLKAQPDAGEKGIVKDFEAPRPAALPAWLVARAKTRGGSIDARAASALADALIRERQVDLRLADNELEKLLTYAGNRAVQAEDVAWLVTPVSLDSIFDFIDDLAQRDGPAASNRLHRFLDQGEHPLRILSLVGRQFRLLAMTQALGQASVAASEWPARLSVPPFVARKLGSQSRRFSERFLDAALRRLRDIDTEIKTGRIDAALALDLFVAGVCGSKLR